MVAHWLHVIAVSLACQVPAPAAGDPARELERARAAVLAEEAAEIRELADQFAKRGDTEAANHLRERLTQHDPPAGASRFHVLPAVEPAPARKPVRAPWQTALEGIQERSVKSLRDLVQRAARTNPPRYSLASKCLYDILERRRDDPEARRLLGFIPYQNGWATPFAARQLEAGLVDHKVFGWVKKDWVEHLDKGELPAPSRGGSQRTTRWLPAAEADQLRAQWKPPWQISTEHFEIQSNVPLSEAIRFGRRLEAFHQLFMNIMADVIGESAPVARRLRGSPSSSGPAAKPHLVYYFGTKQEYVDYLTPRLGAEIARTLGYYDPPRSGKSGRSPAYFFRDEGGQLPVTATLYHEVSHQLLFESIGPTSYLRNDGNFWVFEGLGTYFETVEPQPDGSLVYGGLVGRRVEEAVKSLIERRDGVPFAQFVQFNRERFNEKPAIYVHYQEAMVFVIYLMQGDGGRRRAAFFDYLRDAYHGRIRRATGRTLADRLGEPFDAVESGCLAYLRTVGPRPAAALKQDATADPGNAGGR